MNINVTFLISVTIICVLTLSIIFNRTSWTWPWMIPHSCCSLNLKSQGRLSSANQGPSCRPHPPLPCRSTAWALSTWTTMTTAVLSGHPISGARAQSPNPNSHPSGRTAPWVWPSRAAASSLPSDTWRIWRSFPQDLLLLCLRHRVSLHRPLCRLRFNQWCQPTVTRLSCAEASRRQAPASMVASASLLTVRQSCEDCTATLNTRRSLAEPSTTLATAPTAHVATSSMRTKSVEVRWHLPNSRIKSLPQLDTSFVKVSALLASWVPHAILLLHHSLLHSMIWIWASVGLPPFPHLLPISSRQSLGTPSRMKQQHSSLAVTRPVKALETSTTFLSFWNQTPHAVCVATEIT